MKVSVSILHGWLVHIQQFELCVLSDLSLFLQCPLYCQNSPALLDQESYVLLTLKQCASSAGESTLVWIDTAAWPLPVR